MCTVSYLLLYIVVFWCNIRWLDCAITRIALGLWRKEIDPIQQVAVCPTNAFVCIENHQSVRRNHEYPFFSS